ncbi:MAG: sigma-70 family RNA polymerase sigma factor [Planctomycetes bacterium]|nr:sigma-70 family RNA polymerase sigma factor [Planctomycetota bacterium]
MEKMKETETGGNDCRFRQTIWTSILRAKDRSSPGYRSAAEYLVSSYWKPIYFFIRRKGYDIESAKDLTQSFFAVFLEKDFMKSVERGKGKFRTFMLAALNHFLSKELERKNAQKRGGSKIILSLDFARAETEISLEPAGGETPEKILLRSWAQITLEKAMENLRAELASRKQQVRLDIFETFLSAKKEEHKHTYGALARKFSTSETDVRNCLHRVRRRYKELIEAEIMKCVSDANDVKGELDELFNALS